MIRGIYFELYRSSRAEEILEFVNKELISYGYYYLDCIEYSGDDEYKGRFAFSSLIHSVIPIHFRCMYFCNENDGYVDLKDYEDYMRSDCKAVLFFVDGGEIELYIKDYNMTNKIKNALAEYFQSELDRLEMITDRNDGRYRFRI